MEETENPENGPIPTIDDSTTSLAKSCALCGCSTPAVRCDRCSSQIFCLSCDDMYHRHPKRRLHLRKAVDSIWNSSRSPRLRRRTELPGDPSKIPIPPPRSKKRERHTVGGRFFMKQNHELGSFGHSKMFDLRTIAPPPKGVFAGQKTSPNVEQTYENEAYLATSVVENVTGNEIYENENVPLATGENIDNSNSMGRTPWNVQRTNISSPIQVTIPSSSPDMMTNGQSFNYPPKPQSRSNTDLTTPHPMATHPFPMPHYPVMHPAMHPHLNCPQCVSSSWSNLMSPHPSPFFHPMPWGTPNASLARPGKFGSVPAFPDPNFHFQYPGAFYPNGAPMVDPNFARDLQQQAAETQNVRKSRSGSRQTLSPEKSENMEVTASPAPEARSGDISPEREVTRTKPNIDAEPPKIPEPPKRPWSCLHCTYVNPPGIHVCEICCKTSYGNSSQSENQNGGRSLDSRNSDSPMELVNLDALSQSPDFIKQRPQKDEDSIGADSLEAEDIKDVATPEPSIMLTTETQTSTTTKSTDVQTQNLIFQSIASSTDSFFPKQEISVQTDCEVVAKNCSVATDPMISSQSIESLMSGVSAPPYHNRRAGWGRGVSFSTQSLYEQRGRSRSPIPRSLSEAQSFVRDSSLPPEEAMHSWSQAWLMSDPMYYKPHNAPGYGQGKEDYYDGTWGSMDKLNKRVKGKQGKKSEVNQRPKFHRSLDDLKAEKTQDVIHSRELQFLQTVKEAERCGFSLEDLHVAYLHCGRENPVFWLEDNWSFMIKNVIALAAKYGEDNEENDVGVITASEAKGALHIHRGDIWDAVTECIENRQRKILELTVRGNFTQKQIADALKNNEGNVELAYADLLRASSRRHKFILSPGLSEDSEYNPVDESTLDHTVPTKAGKLDIPTDTKSEKKKSDFLTKLSAIRHAQSERRKAREEKEMIREITTQDEIRVESPLSENMKPDESTTEEPIAEEPVEDIEQELADAKLEFDVPSKDSDKKKDTEDNIPEDYDTNWVESQGEWIEEYSDEQWDEEGDGQWVSLQKKYQSMEKEFEEEAKQMAALWEKEELEDDVFEEEKETEADKIKQEQDAKFQQWVKVNLEKSLSEPEENETNEPPLSLVMSKEPSLSRSVEFDEGLLCKSPLQHYPTEFDLSLKTDPDWVELEVEKEAEFGQEQKEEDTLEVEEKGEVSDEEWEKIDLEIDMLDETAVEKFKTAPVIDTYEKSLTPVAVGKEELDKEQTFEESNLERIDSTQVANEGQTSKQSTLVSESGKESEVNAVLPKRKSLEVSGPKPPVRRRSKLNTAAIEEVLNNRERASEISQLNPDVPPAIPAKKRDKSPENITRDIYAVPDKHKATTEDKSKTEDISSKMEQKTLPDLKAPVKPPRVNLSPSADIESEIGERKSLNDGFSKDVSPVTSLSNESDSNCFADSESDLEIKIIRQKYMHRKAAKYENEEDDIFDENDLVTNVEERESPSELRKEVELQSSAAKGFDFNPELPIPVGTRGSRYVDIDELESPKAFREGNARPLQLFKVTKQSSTEMTPEPVLTEQNKDIDTMVSGIVKAYHEHVTELPSTVNIPQQPDLYLDSKMVDNQTGFVTEPQTTQFDAIDPHYYNTQGFEQLQGVKSIQDALNIQQITPEIPLESFDDNIPIEPIPEEPSNLRDDQPANEEIMFSEVDGAAADYFFGRYDEVVVAKPKKRAPVQKAKASLPAASKVMSTSDMKVEPSSHPTLMEKSASPVMRPSPSEMEKNIQPVKAPRSPKLEEKIVPPVETVKEPEYLSFADDYFFGSYNEVVVAKKGKKKVPPKPIPKVQENAKTDTSVLQPATQMESSGINKIISSIPPTASTSILQHAESTTSLYFDTSSLLEDTFYLAETPEEPVENANGNGRKPDARVKSVHFVDPDVPVVPPPRRNRPKPTESNRSSVSSYTSVADEFMLEQYASSNTLDKKKLHSCSEDFKLNQGCDPPEFSSKSVLNPSDHQTSVVSSEISVCASKEPLNSTVSSNFERNYDISDELRSSELSCSDKVQDFLDRRSPLPQDFLIISQTSDFVSGEEIYDQESLETQKYSENVQESYPPITDSLIVSSNIFEDALTAAENILAEQSSSVDFSPGLYYSETNSVADSSKTYTEAINTGLGLTSVTTDLSTIFQKGVKVNEEDNKSTSKITSHKITDVSDETGQSISDKSTIVPEDEIISDSYTVKLESGSSLADRIQDEQEKSEMERDTYSVHIDDEFEDGLRLVEEAENLINEFCDIYPPGIFDIASSNEIQNLNTKNNKQESTYDSEHEWKLNEERYNTLNASFVENKLYKSKSSSEQHTAEAKDSLIIDTVPSELNVSPEIPASDLPVISELVIESGEVQRDRENQTATYSVEHLTLGSETGSTESSLVIQMTPQPVPVNVIQPLSVLCQTASLALDFEASYSQNVRMDDIETEEGEGISLSESDYSKCELLDASIDVSDKSSVTSTRSSISTQIPVPSDVQIKDLIDELDSQVEMDTSVQIADEEYDKISNNASNSEYIDQTMISDVIQDHSIDFPMADHDTPVPLTPDLDTDVSLAINLDIDIPLTTDLDTEPITTNNTIDISMADQDSEILLTKEHATDSVLIADNTLDNISIDPNGDDYLIAAHIMPVSSKTQPDTNISSEDGKSISFSDEKNEIISMSIDSTNECSTLQIQTELSISEQLQTEDSSKVVEPCLETIISESEVKSADNKIEDKIVLDAASASCANEVLNATPELGRGLDEENNEDSCPSLMSHFYDEWIENVKTSAKSSISQNYVTSKYAAYYTYAESSSNSGSASENEDFTQVNEVEASNLVSAPSEHSVQQTEAEYTETNIDIKSLGDDQVGKIVAKGMPIEIKACSELNTKVTFMESTWDHQEETIHEDIKNAEELPIKISEEIHTPKIKQMPEKLEFEDKIFTFTKSCQTDDSFEEDVFFDSFDDPLMDPSFFLTSINKKENIEPVMVEIGIQCHLITTEVTLPSGKKFPDSEAKFYDSEKAQDHEAAIDESIFEDPMVFIDNEINKVPVTDIIVKPSEDSSFEISEDSDSDLFLEPNTSHNELETDCKRSKSNDLFLSAEIDSGFSSGSDCGMRTFKVTHGVRSEGDFVESKDKTGVPVLQTNSQQISKGSDKRTEKTSEVAHIERPEHVVLQDNKEIKAACEIPEAESKRTKEACEKHQDKVLKTGDKTVSKVAKVPDIEKACLDTSSDKEVIEDHEINIVKKDYIESIHEISSTDMEGTNVIIKELSKTMKEGKKKEFNKPKVLVDETKSVSEIAVRSRKAVCKTISASVIKADLKENQQTCDEKLTITSVSTEQSTVIKRSTADFLTLDSDESNALHEEDIFERAVTPISIVKVPSIEDLTFIEVETDVSEQVVFSETIVYSEPCSTPTVEYFYGPLPASVLSEIESNDCFVEALDLLDPELSEGKKNQLETTLASYTHDDSNTNSDFNTDFEDISESLSSFHDLDEDSLTDSVSEYFGITDDEEKASKNQSNKEATLKMVASNVAPTSETSDALLTQSADVKEELRTGMSKYVKTAEVKDNKKDSFSIHKDGSKISKELNEKIDEVTETFSECIEDSQFESIETNSSSNVKDVFKHSYEKQSDVKLDDKTESVSFERDSLDDHEKTCDASEFEDSLYLDSASEYSLPADTLSKNFEGIKSLIDTSLHSRVEFGEILPNTDENTHQITALECYNLVESIKNNVDSDTPVISKEMIVEEIVKTHTPELSESVYSDILSDHFSFENSEGKRSSEKIELKGQALQKTSGLEKTSTKEETIVQVESSETKIHGSSEVKWDSMLTLESSSTSKHQSQPASAVDENNYLQSIPNYFAPEPIPFKTEHAVSSSEIQTISEETKRECSSKNIQLANENKISIDTKHDSGIPLGSDGILTDTLDENIKMYKSEVPSVPSDIVRYLYYGEDITFEEDPSNLDDSSFKSVHNEINPDSEPIQSLNSEPKESKQQMATVVKRSLSEDHPMELIYEDIPSSKDEESVEYQSIRTFSTDPEHYESAHSEHESTEQWYDLDTTKSLNIFEGVVEVIPKSDSCTETNSLTKEDIDLPCIPELIFNKETKDNFPVAKVDSDEVTDISTHFTMTEDDSDKFSDIESDSSLQEFECGLPIDAHIEDVSTDEKVEQDGEKIACSEGHPDLSEDRKQEIPVQQNMNHDQVPKDQNANFQDVILSQICVDENLEREQPADVHLPIQDLNGNLTENPVFTSCVDTVETSPLEKEESYSELKQEISTPESKDFEISSDLKISTSSSFLEMPEEEFCDVSQASESCYVSQIMESDYFLDANNESFCETEISDFMPPQEIADDAVSFSLQGNNLPRVRTSFETKELILSSEIQNVSMEQEMEKKDDILLQTDTNRTNENVSDTVLEIPSTTEVIVLGDLSETKILEDIPIKPDIGFQMTKELLEADVVKIEDSVKETDPVIPGDSKAIIKIEIGSEKNVLLSDALEQDVIPVEASRELYEIKETKFEDLPREVGVLPSVVSDVVETECMLNFGNKVEISVPLEGNVCHEVLEDSAIQFKPDTSSESASTSHDLDSPFAANDKTEVDVILQNIERVNVEQQEETFSFSKFGYLFKEGKLSDTHENVSEKRQESLLNAEIDLSAKHTEQKTSPASSVISNATEQSTFSETNLDFVEESEQSIITMGQISTVLYSKTEDKHHIEDKGSSYIFGEPVDLDTLEKDVSPVKCEDISITSKQCLDTKVQFQTITNGLGGGILSVESTISSKTATDEISQYHQSAISDEDTKNSKNSVLDEQVNSESALKRFDGIQSEVSENFEIKNKVHQSIKQFDEDEKINIGILQQTSSKIESLSYSETDSTNFYSACDDIDNSSIITSDEDFTDVPSHFTLAEGSEAWSDVETDVSTAFDDCEDRSLSLERDKTPTRDDGGYIFGEDNTYSFKGDINEEAKEKVTVHKFTEDKLETDVDTRNRSSTGPIFEDKKVVAGSVVEKQGSSLPVHQDSSSDKLNSSSHGKFESVDIEMHSKGLIQTTNINEQQSAVISESIDNSGSQILEEKEKSETYDIDIHKKHILVSKEEQDIKQRSFTTEIGIIPKGDNSEILTELGVVDSEHSSCSEFKTVSKDDDTENFSDIESEIYGELEDSLSKADQDTSDFVPFAEDSGKSTVKRNKNAKKSVAKLDSTEVKNNIELEGTKSSDLSTVSSEKVTEQVSLGEGKRTLSLSIADIVEATELDLKTEETTQTLLLEQFADMKSLNEPVAIAQHFTTFEPEFAVPKIHEDAGDVSLHLEMTEESDYWLEAETEYSISEFEDEAVSLSTKESSDPLVMEEHDQHVYATSSRHSDETAAGISTTFYTDTDYSDQMSDCADISLQGGTTDNSDKWSDIEGDAAIEEALSGLAQSSDTNKEGSTAFSLSLQPDNNASELSEVKKPHNDSSTSDLKGTTEKIKTQSKVISETGDRVTAEHGNLQLSEALDASEKVIDSISESYTQPLSDLSACNVTTSGVSEDDFTSITPLDGTADELDKWSDISNDISLEEIQYDRKPTPPRVESDLQDKPKQVDDETLESNLKNKLQSELILLDTSTSNIDKKVESVSGLEDVKTASDAFSESIKTLKESSVKSDVEISLEKDAIDESIVYEELTLDTIQEISEADTSVHCDVSNNLEDVVEATDETGTYDPNDRSTSPAYENNYEDYDNFEGEEYMEGEEYGPNIDENEMEYGDEDYPEGSVPYIENEDELVYPLQSEDWMGESFDLKEYGVDYGMSGSESDVHGYGITDEYEDMQRAIDFNINNFDEAIEDFTEDQNLTTESFKTISNNTPTQSKIIEKEHESWSTADADSIEDDMSEHDNIISKIDELLAEDFGFDHTDYYKDDYNAEGHEETQCITPIESFKTIDTEVTFKTESCASSHIEEIGETQQNLEIIRKREEKKPSVISSKPPSDSLNTCDFVKKDSIVDSPSLETSDEQLNTNTSTSLSQVAYSKTVSVSGLDSSKLSDQSDSFVIQKSSQVVSDTTSTVDSKSKLLPEKSESLTVKETTQVLSEPISKEKSEVETLCEKSPASTGTKKLSEAIPEIQTVTDKTEKVSSESSESFAVKKTSENIATSVDDSKSKASLKLSETFTVKKPSEAASGSIQLDDSNSKTTLEQSESFELKKPSETVSGSVQLDDSNSKTKTEQSESFVLKKPSETVRGSVQLDDSNSKTKTEQSESFVLKKPSETVSGSVQLDDSISKTKTEQSETITLQKTKVSKESIPVEGAKCKIPEQSDSLSVEKTSCTMSSEIKTEVLSKDKSKKISHKPEISDQNRESSSSSEKLKSENLTKTGETKNAQDILPKKDDSQSEVKSSISSETAASKSKQPLTAEQENIQFNLKAKTELSQAPAGDSTTHTDIPIKDEIKAEINIPIKDKSQTDASAEQQLLKSVETVEKTTTTVRRRSRITSTESVEEDPKPDIQNQTVRRRSRITSTESVEEDPKPDIPLKRRRESREARRASLATQDDKTSSSSDTSEENKLKPDIPEKRRRRPTPEDAEKPNSQPPSLPPKTIRRDSSTDSISSSVFSSGSSENLSCYESASLKDSSKSESVAVAKVAESGPDVPERKAPIRQRRRESSDDTSSSSINRSSSSRCSYDLPPKESMDLCRKRTSIDERMVKLQTAGKCTTKETAFIAAKLIEMQFDEEDALLASRQCSSIYHAVKFLTQLCELCQCRFPINSMASMIHCAHRACKECLKAHFTTQIYDRSIFTLLCPICQKPDITDQNIQEYFNHLEMMFRNILDSNVYDLFQRKLRDEVLTKDPNFHWCSQCSSGFIASPRLKKLYCPDCSAITCASCHQTWELEHEGVHCERFQQWKDMHTPEPPPAGLVKFLTDRGISCPSCDLNYAQACGGCMLYKCSHCSYEFCGFCLQPCKRGKDCGNKDCEPRGVHAHHKYNCLFFLRDKDISELQMLLDEESVKFLTIPPKDQIVKSRCQVREQKHTHGSITEDRCGRDIVPYCAGLCRTHYYEYLAELLRKNKINPLPLMTTQDLEFMLRKSRCPVPEKVKGESNEEFYERITETVSKSLT